MTVHPPYVYDSSGVRSSRSAPTPRGRPTVDSDHGRRRRCRSSRSPAADLTRRQLSETRDIEISTRSTISSGSNRLFCLLDTVSSRHTTDAIGSFVSELSGIVHKRDCRVSRNVVSKCSSAPSCRPISGPLTEAGGCRYLEGKWWRSGPFLGAATWPQQGPKRPNSKLAPITRYVPKHYIFRMVDTRRRKMSVGYRRRRETSLQRETAGSRKPRVPAPSRGRPLCKRWGFSSADIDGSSRRNGRDRRRSGFDRARRRRPRSRPSYRSRTNRNEILRRLT